MSIESYRFGSKNQWRREVWAEIARRVPRSERREATVLYLAGPEDLDRKEARFFGFNPDLMIAVDQSPQVVANLRRRHVTAIRGKLSEVVASWPAGRPVRVLIADLCTCVGEEPRRLALYLFGGRCVAPGSIVMLNLQRGREHGTGRDEVRRVQETADVVNRFTDVEIADPKHRGLVILQWIALHAALGKAASITGDLGHQARAIAGSYRHDLGWARSFLERTRPRRFTYRSTVTMDTLVFTMTQPSFDFSDPRPLRRRIAAALAVQTMRRSGQLPASPWK